MKDLTGDVNNPIWELLKKYPEYQFSISYRTYDHIGGVLILTVTNKSGKIEHWTVLSFWCISDPISMIEQLVYRFEECAREVYKRENE